MIIYSPQKVERDIHPRLPLFSVKRKNDDGVRKDGFIHSFRKEMHSTVALRMSVYIAFAGS